MAVCGFDVFIALCDVHFRRKILFFDVVNILDDCPDCYVGVQWFLQLSLYYKVCSCLVTTGRSVPVSFSPSRNNLGTATDRDKKRNSQFRQCLPCPYSAALGRSGTAAVKDKMQLGRKVTKKMP